MRPGAVVALVALLGLHTTDPALHAAQPPAGRVRAAVLRPEPVVLDRNIVPGRVVPWEPVSGLARDDFEVLSDGEPCSIESFSVDAGPVTVALLLDVTPSMRVPHDTLIDSVRRLLIPSLRPADRMALVRLGGTEPLVTPFQSDRRELERTVRKALSPPPGASSTSTGFAGSRSHPASSNQNLAFGFGPSPVWDAVSAAVGTLRAETNTGVVVFTDGRSTGNVHGLSEVIGQACRAGVPVTVIGDVVVELVAQDATTAARVRPQVYLQALADDTGGIYVALFGREDEVTRPARPPAQATGGVVLGMFPKGQVSKDPKIVVEWVGRSMVQAIDALRSRYLIGFSCAARDGQWHPLEVRVRRPQLQVRAPRAYLAGRPGGL